MLASGTRFLKFCRNICLTTLFQTFTSIGWTRFHQRAVGNCLLGLAQSMHHFCDVVATANRRLQHGIPEFLRGLSPSQGCSQKGLHCSWESEASWFSAAGLFAGKPEELKCGADAPGRWRREELYLSLVSPRHGSVSQSGFLHHQGALQEYGCRPTCPPNFVANYWKSSAARNFPYCSQVNFAFISLSV